jgi:hypothetical protein
VIARLAGWLALSTLAAAAVAGCVEPRTAGAPAPPTAEVKRLDDVAMLAVGAPLPALRRGVPVETLVTELLRDPRFARDVAPEMLFNKRAVDPAEEDAWLVLKSTGGAAPVYFLREPCDAANAVRVHPWWALDTEVLVCPDAYQPAHLRQPETGWYCGGSNLDPSRSPFCGCGPELMSCARDDAQFQDLKRGLLEEVIQTVAYVVSHDLPLDRLFTMNETVRTGYSELFYQRWQVVAGLRTGVSDVRRWAHEGELWPREETVAGQHAGLLTTPHMLLFGDTPRARMRNYFGDLWCVTPGSVNVSTEQVLGLGVTDLRDGDGWKKLAVMPVCTDCHARLDHGMQFFSAYPSSFVGVIHGGSTFGKPGPALLHTRESLYGRDANDLRGEGPQTPRGFADLAVKQREFARCMVRDVADHVWSGDATPDDRRALLAAFDRDGTLRSVMREALLRFARQAPEAPPAPQATLRAELDAHCDGCHASGPHAFPRDAAPPRDLLQKMLRQVAFGDMPRAPAEMDAAARRAMVRELVAALWDDEGSRREAARYFDGGLRGMRVHRASAILGMVEQRAGGHDEEAASWTFSDADRHDAVELRPSFAATFALAALRACKASGAGGRALEACVTRALDVDAAVKTPPR